MSNFYWGSHCRDVTPISGYFCSGEGGLKAEYELRERLDLEITLLFAFNDTLGFNLYLFGLNLLRLWDG